MPHERFLLPSLLLGVTLVLGLLMALSRPTQDGGYDGEPDAALLDEGSPGLATLDEAGVEPPAALRVPEPTEGLPLQIALSWPDGRPAADARVTLIPHDVSGPGWALYERARTPEATGRTDADGVFRIDGLAPGVYAVHGAGAENGPGAENGADAGADDLPWTARASHVAAGTVDLTLTLAAPLTYTGRVEDDAGRPLSAFAVHARRADWPPFMSGPTAETEASFVDANGQLVLQGLDAGAWRLSLRADGHLSEFDRIVDVPDAALRTFPLTRTATVSGTLLDPQGAPVAGGEVRLRAEWNDARSDVVETDADGRFQMPSVGPGPVVLTAEADDWARSSERRLDLRPGEQLDAQDVRLLHGGRLAGRIVDASGDPLPGHRLVLQCNRTGDAQQTLSDARGRFGFDALAPGPYLVIAAPDPADEPSLDDGGGPDTEGLDGLAALYAQLDMVEVTLTDERTVEVELRTRR